MNKEQSLIKYKDVNNCLESAINATQDIELFGDEEKNALDTIVQTLNELNTEFRKEIDQLAESSEWEKYCVAFFGETNAGKSTIIESLRILYDEQSRREEKLNTYGAYYSALKYDAEQYRELIDALNGLNCYLSEKENNIQKNLEELECKATFVNEKESEVNNKEKELYDREISLKKQIESFGPRETEITIKEQELYKRINEIDKREIDFNAKEKKLALKRIMINVFLSVGCGGMGLVLGFLMANFF